MDFNTLIKWIMAGSMTPDTDICDETVRRLKMLEKPKNRVDVVIDTDTYNEIDDQFALAYALKLKDKINLQAIYAAPFTGLSAATPENGMKQSYAEILHILDLAKEECYKNQVFYGSTHYLSDEQTPADSPAVDDLIARAKTHDADNPLYVIAIGAITNVASALLREPKLKDHIVVIWHGGTALDWPMCNSFNALQDIAATRVVMGSGVPFVMQPGNGVAFGLTTTCQELEYWLSGKNALCDYLIQHYKDVASKWHKTPIWSHPLVDVAAISWLLTDHHYMDDRLCPTPLISYGGYYEFHPHAPLMRYVYNMYRDEIFNDLFTRIGQ